MALDLLQTLLGSPFALIPHRKITQTISWLTPYARQWTQHEGRNARVTFKKDPPMRSYRNETQTKETVSQNLLTYGTRIWTSRTQTLALVPEGDSLYNGAGQDGLGGGGRRSVRIGKRDT